MPRDRLIVLKFGGSVLHNDRDIRNAVHEIYRWHRDGWRVVAVVSALQGTTDRLAAHARAISETPGDHAAAALLATGELAVAALLCLALDNAGLRAETLDAASIGLRTRGTPTDSAPVSLDTPRLRQSLADGNIVVLPGFIGRDEHGCTTLLGRGGSDLSGLFIAHHLGASRVRLIKDVDALYDRDPRAAAPGDPARRFAALSWDDALALDGGIVQHKAVRFARSHSLPFEVATLHRADASRVGDHPIEFIDSAAPSQPLRVALLGAGTVGLGVYQLLSELPGQFQVVSIAVRDIDNARRRAIPAHLLTTDPAAAATDCDVVVELLGGIEPAHTIIERTLRSGRPVVTANKAVIARHVDRYAAIVAETGASIACSAAVGGALPAIESVRRIADGGTIRALEGVLNGTCNFILDAIADGSTFDAAVARAQALGYAESDPSRDLDGSDAADKLAILIREAWGITLDPCGIERTALTPALVANLRADLPPGSTIRQIAGASFDSIALRAAVAPRIIGADHPLATVPREWNRLSITTPTATHTTTTARGAGRWPTAESVLADLFDLTRHPTTNQFNPPGCHWSAAALNGRPVLSS